MFCLVPVVGGDDQSWGSILFQGWVDAVGHQYVYRVLNDYYRFSACLVCTEGGSACGFLVPVFDVDLDGWYELGRYQGGGYEVRAGERGEEVGDVGGE